MRPPNAGSVAPSNATARAIEPVYWRGAAVQGAGFSAAYEACPHGDSATRAATGTWLQEHRAEGIGFDGRPCRGCKNGNTD